MYNILKPSFYMRSKRSIWARPILHVLRKSATCTGRQFQRVLTYKKAFSQQEGPLVAGSWRLPLYAESQITKARVCSTSTWLRKPRRQYIVWSIYDMSIRYVSFLCGMMLPRQVTTRLKWKILYVLKREINTRLQDTNYELATPPWWCMVERGSCVPASRLFRPYQDVAEWKATDDFIALSRSYSSVIMQQHAMIRPSEKSRARLARLQQLQRSCCSVTEIAAFTNAVA